jgi:hypothetical protein
MKRPPKRPFTPSEDEVLRKYWGKEFCQRIAVRLDRSRNSIISRAKRLKLPLLQAGNVDAKIKKKKKLKTRRTPPRFSRREHPAFKYGKGVRLYDTHGHSCKWVMEKRDNDGLRLMCGHQTGDDQSFCEVHKELIYVEKT